MKELIRRILSEARPSKLNMNREDVLKLLNKYEFLKDFAKNHREIYDKYRRQDWFKEASKNLIKLAVKKGEQGFTPWSPEEVEKESKKYTNRKDFRTKSPLAYRWALKYKLFGDTITHLGDAQDRKPAGYWDYEKLKAEAFKYKTKKEFSEKNSGAVSTAKKMGIWDEITAHMEPLGNLSKRAVYAWKFPDNSIYIGLTYNLKARGLAHLDEEGRTQVSKHIKLTKTTPIFELISDYVDEKNASTLEKDSIDDYRKNGWKILNIAKGGGLGGSRKKWTIDKIKQEAQKFNSVGDFKKNSYSVYVLAQRYGILDDITKNMFRKMKTFNDEEIRNIASKYNSKKEFLKNEPSAAQAARYRGIFDEITKDMIQYIPPTEDEVLTTAKKYTSINRFREDNPSLYNFAYNNNLLPQIRDFYGKSFTKWDFDKLKDVASKYKSRGEFQSGNASAYQSARRQGFLDIFFPPKSQ